VADPVELPLPIQRCPFCQNVMVEMNTGPYAKMHSVWCPGCRACGPDAKSVREAIEWWNEIATVMIQHPY